MSEGAPVEAFSDPILRASAADALRQAAPNARLTAGRDDPGPIAADHWALAVDMGWTGVCIGEEAGGLGLDIAHAADIAEEMGRNLFYGPFAETAVLLPAIAREAAGDFAGLLAGVVSGAVRLALAEPDKGRLAGDGPWELAPVAHAQEATHFLVLREEDDAGLEATLAEVGKTEVEPLQALDATASAGRVRIADPGACRTCRLDAGAAHRVMAPMHVATAADLLGIGEAALERTAEHVRTRQQFGEPLGRFQAIKHRLADVHTALAGSRLAVAHAACNPGDFEAAVLARVIAADAALAATAAAIQFHGGMGFSWELDLHLYLKRARRLNATGGGTARLRAASGDRFIASVLETA